MIDINQKRKELVQGLVILTSETAELLKYKKNLQVTIIRLEMDQRQKMKELKQVVAEANTLKEYVERVKRELDDYRRQEVQDIMSQSEKIEAD